MRIPRLFSAIRRRPTFVLGAALVPLLALSQVASDGSARLLSEASLRSEPGGGSLAALLTADTPVSVLERKDGWVRVRVEGWVPASSIGTDETATPEPEASAPSAVAATDAVEETQPAVAPEPVATQAVPVTPKAPGATSTAPSSTAATPAIAGTATVDTSAPVAATPVPVVAGAAEPALTPVVEPAPSPASPSSVATALGRLEGRVSLRLGRRSQAEAVGLSVLLLPTEFTLDIAPEDTARLDELSEQARKLQREADRAMRGSNFTQATWERDRLMGERADVLDERRDVLAAVHGRHEQAARARALSSAGTDAQGWFGFMGTRNGSYNVYVRLVDAKKDVDVEWLEPVRVSEGIVRLDLDETNAHGVLGKKD